MQRALSKSRQEAQRPADASRSPSAERRGDETEGRSQQKS